MLTGRRTRKQPRGPSGPAAVNQKVAWPPAGGKRCRKRSAAESRPPLPQSGSQASGSPFLCNFVAPLSHQNAPRGLVILSLGVSTGQFASAYILTNYERECADPLVFERGLARGRAEPSDFEGRSAHTLIKLIDLEKDTKERVLTPWIDNLAFPQAIRISIPCF